MSKPEPLPNQANPKVALGFTGEGGIFSDAIYVAIEGSAELIRDKAAFKAHWTSDLDRWFDKGVDTPNIVLIKVKANRITYWDGEEEGEVQVEGTEATSTPPLPLELAKTIDLGEVALGWIKGATCPKTNITLALFQSDEVLSQVSTAEERTKSNNAAMSRRSIF